MPPPTPENLRHSCVTNVRFVVQIAPRIAESAIVAAIDHETDSPFAACQCDEVMFGNIFSATQDTPGKLECCTFDPVRHTLLSYLNRPRHAPIIPHFGHNAIDLYT